MTKASKRFLPEGSVPGMVLPVLARHAVEESRLLTHPETPFRGTYVEGDPRVLLVTGANASGKSLAFRLIAQMARNHDIWCVTLSIRERTGVGTEGMERMRRAFIYGDEETSSTGATSAAVVQSGFRNINGEKPALLGLDEPEIFSHARGGCRLTAKLH